MPRSQAAAEAARRGPKGAGAQVRQSLLRAAADSIMEEGSDSLSFRSVAHRAGVSPAMVPYYFGSRAGLLRGLLEEGFAPVLALLERTAEQRGALAPSETERLLAKLLSNISERPWLPVLMLQNVLAGDALREEFATQYAPRVTAAGARILSRVSEGGALRAGLDPQLSLLSVLATCVFPFLARPVVESVFGLRLDDSFARSQAAHITALLSANG